MTSFLHSLNPTMRPLRPNKAKMWAQAICLALAIVLICPFVSAQWVETNGNVGSATCFAVSGVNVFAGTSEGGVFLSTDRGTSWTQVKSGLTSLNVQSLAVNGTNLFAGTADNGVFRSTDNGKSWTQTNLTIARVTALVLSGSNLFAGAGWASIYLSTDNGASWTVDTSGIGYAFVAVLGASGTNIFAGTGGHSGGKGGMFLSASNGTGWTSIGLTNHWVTALTVFGPNLFVGTADSGVFRSTDSGTSWTAASTGLTNTDIRAVAVSGTNLFAGTYGGGVFLSTNNGSSWTEANSGLITKDVYSLCVSGTNLLAGTGCGVFMSTDNGSSWSFVHDLGGSCGGYVSALSVRGAELFAGAFWGGGRSTSPFFECLFHSTDNGDSWVPQMSHDVKAIVVLGSDVFVGGEEGVFRSTTSGTSWTAADTGLTSTRIQALAASGTNLFAGTIDSGVYLTTNSGVNWKGVSVGLGELDVHALAVSGANLFAGTDTGGVFRSTNNGTSWTAVNNGLPGKDGHYPSVRCFAVSGTNLFEGTDGGGVYLSTNGGASWTASGLANVHVFSLASIGTNLFASGYFGGTFLSTDNGMSWVPANEGLDAGMGVIGFNDTYIFVGTQDINGVGGLYGYGVWRRPLSEMITSVGLPSGALPTQFSLKQNYPNPFNPSTTIKFELPKASHVSLSVYDILGRQVSVLVNDRRDAGVHEVKFDASSLASGVYFYRLQAGDFTQTRRLLLLK